jgi:hypothetical protein
MSQQTLDYRSPLSDSGQPYKRRVTTAALVATGIAVTVNAGLLVWAAGTTAWGALSIMIMIGPSTNAVMALVSLGFIPLLRRRVAGAPILPYVLTGTLVPVAAIAVDGICILAMH